MLTNRNSNKVAINRNQSERPFRFYLIDRTTTALLDF